MQLPKLIANAVPWCGVVWCDNVVYRSLSRGGSAFEIFFGALDVLTIVR